MTLHFDFLHILQIGHDADTVLSAGLVAVVARSVRLETFKSQGEPAAILHRQYRPLRRRNLPSNWRKKKTGVAIWTNQRYTALLHNNKLRKCRNHSVTVHTTLKLFKFKIIEKNSKKTPWRLQKTGNIRLKKLYRNIVCWNILPKALGLSRE